MNTAHPVNARVIEPVRALERGLAVIEALARSTDGLTVGQVATRTSLTRTATRRFLFTLVEIGYARLDGRAFQLSPRILEISGAYLSSLALPELALPPMRTLVDRVRESAALAVLDGDDIVYVAQVPANRMMSISIGIGDRDSATSTSLGRALLARNHAHLISGSSSAGTETARRDYVMLDQYEEDGLLAIAAPIRNATHEIVAAVNLAVHTSRWTPETLEDELASPLVRTAREIEADMSARQAPPSESSRVPSLDVMSEPTAHPSSQGEVVRSLERGLEVFRAYDANHRALTSSQVAQRSGMSRAAARRFLMTLVELDYVGYDGKLFSLRPSLLGLGRQYLRSSEQVNLTLPELAQPYLREFVADTQESATVGILDGSDIVYVAHVAAQQVLSISPDLGARDPAFATSLGRAVIACQSEEWLEGYLAAASIQRRTPTTATTIPGIRARLDEVRKHGYALVDQELESGLRALAVPIRNRLGEPLAAVNVAVDERRWDLERMCRVLLPPLRRAAIGIERDVRAVASALVLPR